MSYIIKITYKDGSDMNLLVPKEEVAKFLDCYRNKKEYWSPNEESGFMTDLSQVRSLIWGKQPPQQQVTTEENKKEEENKIEAE